MSDVMLLGVLRMSPLLWDNSEIDMRQRHIRYLEAADRIENLEKERERWLSLLIKKWHDGEGGGQTLQHYMEMTDDEYAVFVSNIHD